MLRRQQQSRITRITRAILRRDRHDAEAEHMYPNAERGNPYNPTNAKVWDEQVCRNAAMVLYENPTADEEAKLEACTDGTSITKEDCPCDETWTDAVSETHVLDESPGIECFGNGGGTKRSVWRGVATFSAISIIAYVVVLPVFFLRRLSSAKEEGALFCLSLPNLVHLAQLSSESLPQFAEH